MIGDSFLSLLLIKKINKVNDNYIYSFIKKYYIVGTVKTTINYNKIMVIAIFLFLGVTILL